MNLYYRWVHEVLGVGTLNKKPRKGLRKDGTKYLMQWIDGVVHLEMHIMFVFIVAFCSY